MPLHYIHYQICSGEPKDNAWEDLGLIRGWSYYDSSIASETEHNIKSYTEDDIVKIVKDRASGFAYLSPLALMWEIGPMNVWGTFLEMVVNKNVDELKPQHALYVKYTPYRA